MNKARREAIIKLTDRLYELRSEVEAIRDDAINNMDSAMDSLSNAAEG